MMSAADAAQKWLDNTSRATEAYKQGIMRTSVNPMEEAAKNVESYRNGVMQAIESGKWARGLRRVSKEEWQDKSIKLGAARLAQGVAQAKPKVTAFLDAFMPHLQSGIAKVKSMPKATMQDRIQRAVAMMEHNAKFQRGS